MSNAWIERVSSSGCTAGMPSSNIWMQNGQAVATMLAPVFAASAVRRWFTRVPDSSSHMFPPPAPQQSPCSRLRGISTSSAPGIWSSTSRGASMMPFPRPR